MDCTSDECASQEFPTAERYTVLAGSPKTQCDVECETENYLIFFFTLKSPEKCLECLEKYFGEPAATQIRAEYERARQVLEADAGVLRDTAEGRAALLESHLRLYLGTLMQTLRMRALHDEQSIKEFGQRVLEQVRRAMLSEEERLLQDLATYLAWIVTLVLVMHLVPATRRSFEATTRFLMAGVFIGIMPSWMLRRAAPYALPSAMVALALTVARHIYLSLQKNKRH